jgi:hypothetical protein
VILTSRRRGAVAVAALGAALVLSACGSNEAGAAAVVGGRRISVSQVQSAYRDLVPLVGQDQQLSQGDILNFLILEPYLVQAAGQLGRGVSAHDAELEFQQVPNAPEPSEAGVDVLRANLAIVQLQQGRGQAEVLATFDQIATRLKAAGVHVNPRYGAGIDYRTFTMQAAKQDWLKTPGAATPPDAPLPQEQQQPEQPQEQPEMPTEPEPAP